MDAVNQPDDDRQSGDQTLSVVTYAEPGDNGRYEQFLVMPAS